MRLGTWALGHLGTGAPGHRKQYENMQMASECVHHFQNDQTLAVHVQEFQVWRRITQSDHSLTGQSEHNHMRF